MAGTEVAFQVPFVHGLQRHRAVVRDGHIYTYDTERNSADKAAIREAYLDASGRGRQGPLPPARRGVPVAVSVTCQRVLPKSKPGRVRSEPDTHVPDADNCLKLVLDALNGVAWEDDSQVVRASVCKLPRTRLSDEHMSVVVSRPDYGKGES